MKKIVRRIVFVTTFTVLLGCAKESATVIEDSDQRRIVRLNVGAANVYVIEENDRRLMIDAGNPGDEHKYEAQMRAAGIDPESIDYAIITHGHIDHAGTAAAFQSQHGIKIIGGAGDKPMIAAGGNADVCPTSMTARLIMMALEGARYPIFELDHALEMNGETVDLTEFGITGKVLPHPGHTPGSVVVLIGRHAFVGDLIRGGIVANQTPTTHFFMCNLEENRQRIREILAFDGIEQWHPGHFGPFPTTAVHDYLASKR